MGRISSCIWATRVFTGGWSGVENHCLTPAQMAALAEAAISSGELAIRPDRFDAYAGDRAASLSRKEYELLYLLATAEGRVLEREEIYQRVWGYTMVRGDRSVDVFVRKLRHKLERLSPSWRYVHTHFGVGYRFAAEPVVEVREPDRGELPAGDSYAAVP